MLILKDLCYADRGVGPVSLSLSEGQVVLLCGPSGSGKSTLCALLTGELEASSGSVEQDRGLIGTMASDVESQLLGATVGQELELGRLLRPDMSLDSLDEARARLYSYWKGREGEDPQRLSSGEQQLLLLTSLALGPFPLLILDEGLSCLDETAFVAVCRALRALAESGVLILLVSHELRALPWADRCLGLESGQLLFDKETTELLGSDLRQVRVWPGTLSLVDKQRVLGQSSNCSVEFVQGLLPQPQQSTPLPLLAFEHQEFELASGEVLCLAGVTGSGKSRLLMALAGHTTMTGWDVAETGYTVLARQQVASLLWHPTVREELEASSDEAKRRGYSCKSSLELRLAIPEAWLERSPRTLSRGQAKFLACCCLLLQQPNLLLLDEPFGGLDAELRGRLENCLREYLRSGGRIVFTTHRADEMLLYPHCLLLLEQGRPAYHGKPSAYFQEYPDSSLGKPSFQMCYDGKERV